MDQRVDVYASHDEGQSLDTKTKPLYIFRILFRMPKYVKSYIFVSLVAYEYLWWHLCSHSFWLYAVIINPYEVCFSYMHNIYRGSSSSKQLSLCIGTNVRLAGLLLALTWFLP